MLEISKLNNTIAVIIDRLQQKNRIDETFVRSFNSSYDQPTLQIGVVGKMNTGKSALINAIIFGGDILPSSSEPVTVTLTKITYGKENRSSVEFLSEDDINSIKRIASYDGNNPDNILQKEAAEEILHNLPSNYCDLLGQVLNDIPNSELSKYVAADGKYSGLIKSVLMEINNDDLKGITIIDTPGFNDPVVSRGETTTKFLSDCHIILFVHNSDGYDQTDATLLNQQIEYAGISKIVDVFNKMDTRKSLSFDGWNQQLESFLEDRECYLSQDKHPNAFSLIKDSDAVAVSAFMALCGQRPKETRSDFIKTQISKFEERYPELTANESISLEDALVKYSNIDKIITILNRISIEGKQYLIEKPINTLIGKLNAIAELIQIDIDTVNSDLKLLKQNRESAVSDLEGLQDFMASVQESIINSPMEVLLLDNVLETRKLIQSQREKEANSITKQRFPEPGLLGNKKTKANIAAYNTFLARFQSILRGDYESLSRILESTANEYIRNTLLSLVNPKVSEERRENFELKAKNHAKSHLQHVNVVIPAYSISSLPSGRSEQWSLLKTNFLGHYDDEDMDKILQIFKEVSHGIGAPSVIIHILAQMEEDMVRNLSKSPGEIEGKIIETEAILNDLNKELSWVQDQLKLITNLR